MQQRTAGNAERDLEATRSREIECKIGRQRCRQTDDRRRITGQHAAIGLRRFAQIDRDRCADADPDRQDQTEQLRGIRKQRHEQQRHQRADHRAQHAIERFRQHHSSQRLRDDVDRGDAPAWLRQIQAEGDVQRQHRGDERLQGEQAIAPSEFLNGLEHADENRSVAARAR